jgi:hypothetical protein
MGMGSSHIWGEVGLARLAEVSSERNVGAPNNHTHIWTNA